MTRDEDGEVELTVEESRAARFYDTCRDNGVNSDDAVRMVRMCTRFVDLSEDFFTWLGQ